MAIHYGGDLTCESFSELITTKKINHVIEVLMKEFDKLISDDIFRVLKYHKCPDPLDHKDEIKQLTWLAIYIDIEKYRSGQKDKDYTNPVGWVFRIQRRFCIKHLIRCKREQLLLTWDDTILQNYPDNKQYTNSFFKNNPIESKYFKKEVLEYAREYFYNQPKEQRIAFELYLNDFQHDEIAFFLNIKTSLSRQWISRGIREIRKTLLRS